MVFWQDILFTVPLLYPILLWCVCESFLLLSMGWGSAPPQLVMVTHYHHTKHAKSLPWTTEQQNQVISPGMTGTVADTNFFFSCKSAKPHFTKIWDQILLSATQQSFVRWQRWESGQGTQKDWRSHIPCSWVPPAGFGISGSKPTLNVVTRGIKRGLTALKF